jgi:hypothetical protein
MVSLTAGTDFSSLHRILSEPFRWLFSWARNFGEFGWPHVITIAIAGHNECLRLAR